MNQPNTFYLLDEICSRFDSAWFHCVDSFNSIDAPELQSYLNEVEPQRRAELFQLLLAIDLEYRRKRSLPFDDEQYANRFPEFRDLIEAAHVSCETITVDADTSLRDDSGLGLNNSANAAQTLDGSTVPSGPHDRTSRQQIGRYVILQPLGGGGQGTVYRAAHPTLPIEVAIKVGNQQLSDAMRKAMVDEAHVLCELDHPGIAKIRDLDFDEQGRPILVLELVRGRSLDRLLRDETVSVELAAQWLASAAEAVGYAHRRGVLHLDLKPANIVVTENGEAKVIDFGLARLRHAWNDPAPEPDRISGTPDYMAPEQASGTADKITSRSDIFSLGAILYRILTGSAPFQASSPQRAVMRSQRYDLDWNLLENAQAPKGLIDVCRCALAKQPADRYRTAEDFTQALKQNLTPTKLVPEAVSPQKSASFSIRILGVGITLAVTLSLLALVPVLFGKRPFELASRTGDANSNPIASSAPPAPRESSLEGDVKLSVIRDGKAIPIEHATARPLRGGDGLRIEANLNQPAYLYLIWIDENGTAQPFYPGEPGNWQSLSVTDEPVQSIVLPSASEGYGLQGRSGMQTIVLLARATPLPQGDDLGGLFDGLPQQSLQDERALVFLEQGNVSSRPDRAPDFFATKKVDDPVLATQEILRQRLQDRFPLMRSVSVAYAGHAP